MNQGIDFTKEATLVLGELTRLMRKLDIPVTCEEGSHPQAGRATENPDESRNHYYCWPLLFADNFPALRSPDLRTLCLSGGLYFKFIVQNDRFVDSQTAPDHRRMSNSWILYKESLKLLHSIFDSDSTFWKYMDLYEREHVRAVHEEKTSHFGTLKPYSRKEMLQVPGP